MTLSAGSTLQALIEGNQQFQNRLHQKKDRSLSLSRFPLPHQPKAVVIGCSDARVPVEMIFNQAIGQLFVIRTAGQVVSSIEIGSVEYAVAHLGVPLVVVLGHSDCGAVGMCVKNATEKQAPSVHIAPILEDISLSLSAVKKREPSHLDPLKELISHVIDEHIHQTISRLKSSSSLLRSFVATHQLRLVGARYDMETGAVTFFHQNEAP